jgi:hypothetical protein
MGAEKHQSDPRPIRPRSAPGAVKERGAEIVERGYSPRRSAADSGGCRITA